jgi:uncharacterized 2Fe-2S/4Fe-4S cluster protein (DUF4445 family)
MTIRVDFEPVGRRGDCPEGQSLLECARQLGVDLVNLCGGAGSCGRCKVQVLEGNVTPPMDKEASIFTPAELADGYRLACRTVPLTDCKICVPPESLTTPQRTQVEGEEVPVAPDPLIATHPVAMEPPSLDDLRSDAARLSDALVGEYDLAGEAIGVGVLRSLSPQLREWGWRADVVLRDNEIVALLPPSTRPLGMAVDLGTTKIAGYLLDLESGQPLASKGVMNPQIAYGEDVVARLTYAGQSPEQAALLQRLLGDALSQLAADLCAEIGADSSHIVEAVVVGNTAIHHLLVGLPVWQLARAPYVPAVSDALDIKAQHLGIDLAPGAVVHLLPNIAGYVGADHVAVILATDLARAEGVVLALDIGTNTEICLANHGRLSSVSCASGPAFEGAHIRHGMRAAVGAIERLRIEADDVVYQTIGGGAPVGICGSGILDALAQLYQAGVLNASGRMLEGHPRVREGENGREFVLVSEDEQSDGRRVITFTQKDVRELQLAKGAMRSGILALLVENDLQESDIDRVIIAGAFGTYIDVASAISIGMLPRLPLDRFRQVGNAAGMGAKMALISRTKREEARALARRVGYVELATDPQFMKTFSETMALDR